jgi:hypothetical protein
MAVPVGDTWDYVGKFSPQGISFNYRFQFTPRLAVGAIVGWNNFHIKESGAFNYDPITITGTQTRSLDVFHFGGCFNYNFLPIGKMAVPYVGIDLAAYHIWQMTDFGWWTAGSNSWHFGFAPALGGLLHLPTVTLMFGSKFQMAVQTDSADQEMYVSFNIGAGLN